MRQKPKKQAEPAPAPGEPLPEGSTLDLLQDSVRDYRRRKASGADVSGRLAAWAGRIRQGLTVPQLGVVDSRSRRVALLTARRAGKTYSVFALMVLRCLAAPRAQVVYVGESVAAVEERVWSDSGGLPAFVRDSGLTERDGLRIDNVKHRITFPNGSTVRCMGADDQKAVDKFRGKATGYSLVVIDEAQSDHFRDLLRPLVERVLPAAVRDKRGQIVLSGTPGDRCVGLFYEVTSGRKSAWDVRKWSFFDNLRYPDAHVRVSEGLDPDVPSALRSIIREELTDRGLTEAEALRDPDHRRENLGEWVEEETGLLFDLNAARNTRLPDGSSWSWRAPLPEGHRWRTVLGVDLGRKDAFAVFGWAFSPTFPRVLQCYEVRSDDLTSVDDWIHEAERAYGTLVPRPEAVLVDPGAKIAVAYVDALRDRGLPAEEAEKSQKAAFVRLMNSDLRAGRLVLDGSSKAYAEMSAVELEPATGIEVRSMPMDLGDAALYAWRYLSQVWAYRAPPREESEWSRRERELEESEDRADERARWGAAGSAWSRRWESSW